MWSHQTRDHSILKNNEAPSPGRQKLLLRTERSAATTIVKRTYSTGLQNLRSAILAKFGRVPNSLPFPFREMHAIELKPPQYGPGWLEGWADGGGFLQTYKRIPAAEKLQDLYINDWTGDIYWPSEYFTLAGPAKFHCGFIVHLAEQAQNRSMRFFTRRGLPRLTGDFGGLRRFGLFLALAPAGDSPKAGLRFAIMS
jgi:hypothetical protein